MNKQILYDGCLRVCVCLEASHVIYECRFSSASVAKPQTKNNVVTLGFLVGVGAGDLKMPSSILHLRPWSVSGRRSHTDRMAEGAIRAHK